MKRRTKIILGIVAGLGGFFFALTFPPTRYALGQACHQSSLPALRTWGLAVLAEQGSADDITALRKALNDESSDIRLAAVEALGQMGEAAGSAGADLVKAARDENNEVSKAAAKALSDIGVAALDGLIEQLGAEDERYRQAAATALLNLKEQAEPARPALLKAIQDENAGVQILSSQCLLYLPKPELSIPTMLRNLDREDEATRTNHVKVTRSLILMPGYLEGRKSVSDKEAELILGELMKALIEDDLSRRVWAAHMLGKCGLTAQEAIPELLNNCAHKDEGVRVSAIIAVEKICRPIRGGIEPNLLKLFLNSLKEKNPEARKAALRGLTIKELDPTGAKRYPAFVKCLGDKDKSVAKEALLALVLEGSKAVPTLVGLLKDKNSETVDQATKALAFIGKPALRSLRIALKHKTIKVRKGAAESLARMGDAGLPALISAVKGNDTGAQTAAIYGLSLMSGSALNKALIALIDEGQQLVFIILQNMGESAAPIIPRLSQELKNPSSVFHSITLLTLGKIGPSAKDAIPAVLPFLEHPDGLLRRSAADALGAISPMNKDVLNRLEYMRGDKVPFVREAAEDALAAIRERGVKKS